jgi:hypothetical protein
MTELQEWNEERYREGKAGSKEDEQHTERRKEITERQRNELKGIEMEGTEKEKWTDGTRNKERNTKNN